MPFTRVLITMPGEYGLPREVYGWVNVWDAGGSGDVFRLYNVQDPPLIMLLDKDKGILTERLSVEELSYIIKTLMPDEPLF